MKKHLLALTAFFALGAGLAQLSELPPGPGRDLAFTKCQQCHDLGYVLDSAGIDRAEWKDLIESMMDAGLELTPEEFAILLDYFSTYMGPNPPPPPEKVEEKVALDVKGIDVYTKSCVACHGKDGQGVPGAFPPLANNPYVAKDRAYPALVVLFGLTGPIEVHGQTYNGIMPSFAHLSDAEIAAVVEFVRTNFNAELPPKDFKHLTAEEIKALRAKKLNPDQVRAYREKIKVK